MTREIYTGEEGGGRRGTSLINRSASVDSSVPSCHSALIDGQSRRNGVTKADGAHVCVREAVF